MREQKQYGLQISAQENRQPEIKKTVSTSTVKKSTLFDPLYLFDGADHLKLSRGVEVVALLAEQQAEVAGDVAPGHVHPHDGVGDGEALVDGHHVGHPVPGVQDHACGPACGIPSGGGGWGGSMVRGENELTEQSYKINHTLATVRGQEGYLVHFWWFLYLYRKLHARLCSLNVLSKLTVL